MGFPISDLVERTGVGATTIHYYVRLGLLPPARKPAPNRFEYDEGHVRSLRLIRALRDHSKPPLSLIEKVLPELLAMDDASAWDPAVWNEVLDRHRWATDSESGAAKLLRAAVDAFSTRGFESVNVEELCAAAGVAKGSFYSYFPSKQDLFFEAGKAAAREVGEMFAGSLDDESVPPSPQEAAVMIGDAFGARLPLFLELLIGALQNRPGYAETAKWVMVSLAYDVGTHIDTHEPLLTGAGVLETAVVGIFWEALMPTPVDHPASTVQPA